MKNNLEKILLTIMVKEEWTIRSLFAQEVLKRKPNIKSFIKDFLKFGCELLTIESLYEIDDIHLFFKEHYSEISNILLECKYEKFYFYWKDLITLLVSLAFEKVARDMAINDLGLEII